MNNFFLKPAFSVTLTLTLCFFICGVYTGDLNLSFGLYLLISGEYCLCLLVLGWFLSSNTLNMSVCLKISDLQVYMFFPGREQVTAYLAAK